MRGPGLWGLGEGAKKLIDAEDLVRWAASEELRKKRSSTIRAPLALSLSKGDGELVGKWTRPPGFPAIHPMFAAARGSGPGALGSRPDWRAEPFAVSPVLAKNGKPAVFRRDLMRMPTLDGIGATFEGEIRCERLRSGLYPKDAYSRLDYDPSPQFVVDARADYLIWRAAIAALAEKLEGALLRFEPLAPAAALAPWITGEAQ